MARVLLSENRFLTLDPRQGWGYSVSMLDNFLLTLFDKYAELLKRRFSEDFQEVQNLVRLGIIWGG